MNTYSHPELDIIPPMHPLTLMLHVSPQEIELAVATHGDSLRSLIMQAIVSAMVVDPLT